MKWYISIERRGFSPVKMKYNDFIKADKEYNDFKLLEDSQSAESDGRVWLCRADGFALKVNYFSLDTKLPREN